jgi:formate C-acetyltransferase
MEIHDTVFRNGDGVARVAALVKAFIDRGGHQLQLNAIDREVLLDAQKHPEDHKNLIVRVWGWSGYFCELDTEYQDHIISRTEFMA